MSSTTSKYRVEIRVPGVRWTPASWPTRHAGRASDANLLKYVRETELSTRSGGCNAHLGETVIQSAKIVNQSTGETVASYWA